MCSIFGYISDVQNLDLLKSLSSLMKHRGEDSEGYYADKSIFLGHNRLAIQDTSTLGNQPMWSANKRYVLIFNGEIYNHLELRNKLDITFASNSDTETLLYLLIAFGKSILNDLNGIFSFAFYDTQSSKLLLARDVLGVKPFYYYQSNTCFTFASEIRSIIHHPDFEQNINNDAIRNYLVYTYNPANTTIYEQVNVFPTGSYLEIDTSKKVKAIEPVKYYQPSKVAAISDEKLLLKTLENKLLESIERQLISDVPIGIMLSGGLDSSAVLALAKVVNSNIDFPCFSIVQPELKNEGFQNDIDFARLVAKHFNQNLHEVSGDLKFEDLSLIIQNLEEPCADVAPLYVYRIAELAKKQGIKVLLSGSGADELWAGYNRHLLVNYQNIIGLIPNFVKQIVSKNQHKPLFRRINKIIGRENENNLERQLGYFCWHDEKLIDSILVNSSTKSSQRLFDEHLNSDFDLFQNVLNCEQNTYLPRHNLMYNDKMGMAHGVEVRVPLLDLELFKFSENIPSALKVKGLTGKYLFREVMKNYLPKEIINRSKTGFGAPIRTLVKQDWSQEIRGLSSELSAELFDLKAIDNMIDKNSKNEIDAGYALMCLVMMSNLKI